MSQSITQIPFNKLDGTPTSLEEFSGSVVLIVNVASKCGLTPQYEQLVELYHQYKDKGLVVLGFPANNFASQEPGSNSEIATFCSATYGVDFPMAEKISVNGADRHPLYQALIAAKPDTLRNPDMSFEKRLKDKGLGVENESDITWNFEKFLLSTDGQVIGRFAPDIEPTDQRITSTIEKAL
ncbi:glutathione peroxidase [Celerinatantimonas diazotrophica]|uniref:Glutathione peroxidase n=1 Tax=Celerinatantimonas diazotrophica TaxID=412034 RepID=A0A4R1JLD4_9GAMM|nr:glutathione peroxidase [Celerinatantimonas diazotrophica]TCK51862.1 glutathione peroxidase [Celerinatantimonas diazotrophica]CAG9296445.1 Thioredoxin/glutathione peroxidase BtuE [Celerinatantimonas diazotrophica]